jgi:hypothetical protein
MTDHDEVVARTVTALGLVGIALIHILELPSTLDDQGYVGALFIAAIVASLPPACRGSPTTRACGTTPAASSR